MKQDLRTGGRRRFILGGLALAGFGLITGCEVPRVQTTRPSRTSRVGFLALGPAGAEFEAFRDGLRELGYVEGQTITIEARWATSPDGFPALAAELAGLPIDLMVTAGAPATQAAMDATSTVPIVFAGAADPVRSGLVASLSHPSGNVTGLSSLATQVQGKRLQLLRDVVPGVTRVMFLADTTAARANGSLEEAQQAAQSLGLDLLTPTIRGAEDLPPALEAVVAEKVGALLVTGQALIIAEQGRLVDFSVTARVPLVAQDRSFPVAGGLLSYGPSRLAWYRRAATYVDKILKGTKPADLPVEQPTVFDFVINLKTAKILGLTIPQTVLTQATEVIQ